MTPLVFVVFQKLNIYAIKNVNIYPSKAVKNFAFYLLNIKKNVFSKPQKMVICVEKIVLILMQELAAI